MFHLFYLNFIYVKVKVYCFKLRVSGRLERSRWWRPSACRPSCSRSCCGGGRSSGGSPCCPAGRPPRRPSPAGGASGSSTKLLQYRSTTTLHDIWTLPSDPTSVAPIHQCLAAPVRDSISKAFSTMNSCCSGEWISTRKLSGSKSKQSFWASFQFLKNIQITQ